MPETNCNECLFPVVYSGGTYIRARNLNGLSQARFLLSNTLERNSRPSKPNVCDDNHRNGHQKCNDNKDKNNQSGMWVNFSLRPQLTKREKIAPWETAANV